MKKHFSPILGVVLGILTVAAVCQRDTRTSEQTGDSRAPFTAAVGNLLAYESLDAEPHQNTLEYRIAKRMRHRLRANGVATPRLSVLAEAVSERHRLLRHKMTVTFTNEDGTEHSLWDISLHAYPTWMQPQVTSNTATFVLDEDIMRDYLKVNPLPTVTPPVDAELLATDMTEEVVRATTSTIAKPGYEFDIAKTTEKISQAFKENAGTLVVALTERPGRITYVTEDGEKHALTLVASGKSNYKGSPAARIANVRKAINEHVHNSMALPGEVFSFNALLDGPVSQSNGWHMAKIIVNGGDLELAPGGGICQASTTVYRAVVNAGFPVLDRKAHSLYVTYYKQYGVGIDATIFPGSQDLVFVNDLENPILIQAYDTEEQDVMVNIYGVPDKREVAVEGPYFSINAPEDLLIDGRAIKYNEIAWVQTIRHEDGREEENVIVSRYKELPRSVAKEFAVPLEVASAQ
jgi:vancomycin resistance protein YoaR